MSRVFDRFNSDEYAHTRYRLATGATYLKIGYFLGLKQTTSEYLIDLRGGRWRAPRYSNVRPPGWWLGSPFEIRLNTPSSRRKTAG